MKKVFHVIAVLVLTCSLLPSCKMRPEDAVRLKAEAEVGNLKSMEMLAANADTLISASERNHYMDVLTENGNFLALSGRFSEEFFKSGKLSEKQWQAMYMRWMEKGAKMGTPDCMYRLGVMYQEKEHLDTAKAMYWFRQAADSLQASARVELRKAAGELTALDAPRFAFRQMWDYNAPEQSFLNRFSNATFHFMSECLISCWKNLFSARWWQSLLLMLMMLGVLIAGIIFALSRRGREGLSVAACGIYGWINGMTLFLFAKGKSAIPGILVSSDAIGQFTRQPATFGLISDICIWASWCCLIIIVLVYLVGLLRRIRLGVLSVWTFFTYTVGTVFSCVFFYCLAGGVSAMSRAIGFILAAILALFMFGGDISDEDLMRMEEAHIKRQQEEEERRRRKEDKDRWERQQRAWDRDKNA